MKSMFLLVLLTSIITNLYAQKPTDIFDIPQKTIIRIFFIDLDKGDKMKFELTDMEDLNAIGNLDSILQVFVKDLEPLRDSISDPLLIKKIDYIIDASGKNKMRIKQSAPIGSSYLVDKGSVAAMKIDQDTICIILKAPGAAKELFKKQEAGSHYYRISFYLNNLDNVAGYMKGRLQENVNKLNENASKQWVKGKEGMMYSKKERTISSKMPRGQLVAGDYLTFRLTADIQNYKNYFVPSLSVGVIVVTNRNAIKREYSYTAESHFTFAENDQKQLQTFRNTFSTLGFHQTKTDPSNWIVAFNPSVSFGWLARQRGNIYEKNTFRFSFGRASLFDGAIKVDPIIYFHDFFKGVTPGIRLSL